MAWLQLTFLALSLTPSSQITWKPYLATLCLFVITPGVSRAPTVASPLPSELVSFHGPFSGSRGAPPMAQP